MSPIDPIERTGSRQIYKVDPVYLNGITAAENPFKGYSSGWQLFTFNYGEGGLVDPTEYLITGEEYHCRTLAWA